MTVPKSSLEKGGNALPTGTEVHSTDTGEPSRAASLPLIRSWSLTALSLCLLPLLLSLGVWQLQRGEEKQQLLDGIDARLSAQPHKISQLGEPQTYTPVRLLGYYTDEYFYLDNRTRNGRVGYEILQVFISGDQRWLVNRGWIAAGSHRTQLPQVNYPRAAKVITGFLYPTGENTVPGESDKPSAVAPARIQSIDTSLVASLSLSQPAWHIRLSADSDTALVTDWQLVNSNPERHRGYAVQWFCMAAALVVLWLLAATNIRSMMTARQRSAKSPRNNSET